MSCLSLCSYHYDMSAAHNGATWLSDTWSLSLATQRWRRLHGHVVHPSQGPLARYAAIATLVGGDLFLHGGDDGGNSERLPSYKHAVFGDMWRFILNEENVAPKPGRQLYRWERVRAVVSEFAMGGSSGISQQLSIPAAEPRDDLYRTQHAGTLVLLADGSSPCWIVSHGLSTSASASSPSAPTAPGQPAPYEVLEMDSVWMFDFGSKKWSMVRTTVATEGGGGAGEDGSAGPQARFGHALTFVAGSTGQLESDDAPAGSQQQRRGGSLLLYGGSTRKGVILGDLWRLWLPQDVSDATAAGLARPAFQWVRLHTAYRADSGLSPAPRSYHALSYTPDGTLHLFGGARCQPGCVCSAEYWTLDLAKAEGIRAGKLQTRNDVATTTAADEQSAWTLLAASPHSPSSASYPSRNPPADASAAPFKSADESVAAGWPLHRYKHSMLPLPISVDHDHKSASTAAGAHTFSFLLFGGEAYNPSAYLHDTWRFDYTLPLESSGGKLTHQALKAAQDVEVALHLSPVPSLDSELAEEQQLLPPSEFHRHEPPGGWGAAPTEEVFSAGISRGSMQQRLIDAAGGMDAAQLLQVVAVAFILAALAAVILARRCLLSREKQGKGN